jgi:hypothetical protein
VDQHRFDTVTRTISTVRSRRAALGTLLAGTLGLLDLAETSAKKACATCKKRKHGKCKANKQLNNKSCPDGSGGTCQNGVCVKSSSEETPPEPPPTCPTGACSRNSPCGSGCVCLDIGGGTKRCLTLGTCSDAGDCASGSCGSGCTCVNPGGRRSGCASTVGCPDVKCTSHSECGSDCLCINPGTNAARCVSRVRAA